MQILHITKIKIPWYNYSMINPKKIVEDLPPKNADTNAQEWRLKLDKNENIYGVSKFVINSLKNMDFDKISLYSNPEKLIEKLSQKYNRKKNNFLITNGDNEAFNLITGTYLDKEREMLSYNPLPSFFVKLQNAEFKEIQYREKYKFDIKEVGQNISDKTDIIYLSTPDEITGELVKPHIFKALINQYPNILFIINCSYINFAGDIILEDYLDLADEFDNVAVIKSFSYDYALAGAKSGFIYAKNNIIENIKKIAPEPSVDIFAIQCAYSTFGDEKYYNEIAINNSKARKMFFDELLKKGFKPYQSSANFILCDFFDYCDFYYQKLKNNGVIVKKFDKHSQYSTCLRITVSKEGGIKFISELLNKKDILIINPDNVILDTEDSLDCAIAQVFRYFTDCNIASESISHARNLSGYNCAWDIARYLLEEKGNLAQLEEIINVFINLFYNPKLNKPGFLIDKDKLLLTKEDLEKLSQKYDMVLFSDRFKMHLDYSLEKYEIDKYFHYMICADDLAIEFKKPNKKGVMEILKHCPHKSAKYVGANVDDIICAKNADIETIGVVSAHSDKVSTINNYRHIGANCIVKDVNEIKTILNKNEQKLKLFV